MTAAMTEKTGVVGGFEYMTGFGDVYREEEIQNRESPRMSRSGTLHS